MGLEVELKLELDPAGIEHIRRHELVRERKQARATSVILENTYYDTPDQQLLDMKAGLRLRRIGRRWRQTLKLAGEARGSHFARPEWEWDIPGPELVADLLQATPLSDWLARTENAMATLEPQFSTNFRRTSWILGDDDWEAELCIDSGNITVANGDSLPISEVELELRRGTPWHLYELARTLTAGIPCRITLASKAERGYALLHGLQRAPVKAPLSRLTADMTVCEALQAIGRDCLGHALANEASVRIDRHPEGIHQFRVALRRLRSALSMFRPLTDSPDGFRVREGLRWLAAAMGDARDWDVFSSEILAPTRAALCDDMTLPALAALVEQERAAALQRAVEALEDPRSGAILLETASWLEGGDWLRALDDAHAEMLELPLRQFSTPLLEARARKVLRRGRHFHRLPSPARHALRIEIKKLRYAVDFFSPLYSRGKRWKNYERQLSTLQDLLGGLNDGAVACQRLLALATGQQRDPVVVFAAGLVAGWQQQVSSHLLRETGVAWKDFMACKPFWHQG